MNYVYIHHIINVDLYYVGRTTMSPRQRFQRACYKGVGIYEYTDERYHYLLNDPNIKTIVMPVMDKNQAKIIEDRLLVYFQKVGKSLNKFRSGLNAMERYRKEHREERIQQCKDWRTRNKEHVLEYNQKYREQHQEERKEQMKAWRSRPEYVIYQKVDTFNRNHPDKKIETALEARRKFIESGYIPDYIKL